MSYCARCVMGWISGRFGSICCTTLRAEGKIASGSPWTRISTCILPMIGIWAYMYQAMGIGSSSMLRYLWSFTTPTIVI